MSYSYFVACSHPLPEGWFGAQPLRIYDSYADYMRSADYVPVKRRRSYAFDLSGERVREEEARRAEMKGLFFVYANRASSGWKDAVLPIQPRDEWVRGLLTLPYQYDLGWSSLDPLCRFLRPDAKCELLNAWVGGDDRMPLSPTRYRIDLANYALKDFQAEDLARFELEEGLRRNAIADVVPLAVPLSDADYVRLDPALLRASVGYTYVGNPHDCTIWGRMKPGDAGFYPN